MNYFLMCETITFTPRLFKMTYKKTNIFSSHVLFFIKRLLKNIEIKGFALMADSKLVQKV